MPAEQEARPPYVSFETRAVEDRNATIETGHFVAKDVIFAIVTPAGSRDKLEKEAEAWIKDLRDAVSQDRFPSSWFDAYEKKLQIYKETQEVPEDGTPIMNWPALSPAQVRTILSANVRTIEDLAEANEATMARIGMGARALKEKALAWLSAAEGPGKVSAELHALRTSVEEMTNRVQVLESQKSELESALASAKKKPATAE